VVGGLILGLLESMSGAYISAAYKDVFTFAILMIILVISPQGVLRKVGH